MEVYKEMQNQNPSKVWVNMAQKAINDYQSGRISAKRFRSKLSKSKEKQTWKTNL